MSRPQPFGFGLADSLLAEVGETPLDALHWDVDAICHCYDTIRPVADRLGIDHKPPERSVPSPYVPCQIDASYSVHSF